MYFSQYILAYLLSVCTIRARKPIEEREWLDENAQPALVAHVFIKPLGIVECYTQNYIYHHEFSNLEKPQRLLLFI